MFILMFTMYLMFKLRFDFNSTHGQDFNSTHGQYFRRKIIVDIFNGDIRL